MSFPMQAGVYANAVHMIELDLLLKKRLQTYRLSPFLSLFFYLVLVSRELLIILHLTRCKEYWKERMIAERAEKVKQSKEYWDSQTKYVIGY